jgi:hypothetical protein
LDFRELRLFLGQLHIVRTTRNWALRLIVRDLLCLLAALVGSLTDPEVSLESPIVDVQSG